MKFSIATFLAIIFLVSLAMLYVKQDRAIKQVQLEYAQHLVAFRKSLEAHP